MSERGRATPGGVASCPRHGHMDGRIAAAGSVWDIRAIEPGDRADAKELFLKLHTYNAGLDRALTGGAGMGLLAREGAGGRAVGLVLAAMHRDAPLWAVRDWLELEDVYIEPAWRGTGLAAALVARVEE